MFDRLLIIVIIIIIVVFHSCCSDAQVLGTKLVHELHILYSDTELYLALSALRQQWNFCNGVLLYYALVK